MEPGNARVVDVGFGANKHAPVGSIAGSRNWLHPQATATNNETATMNNRISGGFFAGFSWYVRFIGLSDGWSRHGGGSGWGKFSFWTDLSNEPYHA